MAQAPKNKNEDGNDKSGTVGDWLESNDDSKDNQFTLWLTVSGIKMNATFDEEVKRNAIDPEYVTAWAVNANEWGGVINKFNTKVRQLQASFAGM